MSNFSLIPFEGAEEFNEGELQLFEEQHLVVIKEMADMTKQMKSLEDQLKKVKKDLGKVMDDYGVKSMDCPWLKFTRVSAGEDKTTIDLEALKDKEPELYAELVADYPKKVKGKAASVRFEVK